jgi:hypothetical protein
MLIQIENCWLTADFVRGFIRAVPSNLKEYELYILAGQLRPTGAGDTVESMLRALRRAIENLPERRPTRLPPMLNIHDIRDLQPPGTPGFDIGEGTQLGSPGPGQITLLPGPSGPRAVLPEDRASDVAPLFQITLPEIR